MLGKGLALSERRSMGLSHRAGLVLGYPDEKEGQPAEKHVGPDPVRQAHSFLLG